MNPGNTLIYSYAVEEYLLFSLMQKVISGDIRIYDLQVRIPLWDMGGCPTDEAL
jgi:hypothetical protein